MEVENRPYSYSTYNSSLPKEKFNIYTGTFIDNNRNQQQKLKEQEQRLQKEKELKLQQQQQQREYINQKNRLEQLELYNQKQRIEYESKLKYQNDLLLKQQKEIEILNKQSTNQNQNSNIINNQNNNFIPTIDIYENDESYLVKVELVGVEKQDVSIDAQDKILKINGVKKNPVNIVEKELSKKVKSQLDIPLIVEVEQSNQDSTVVGQTSYNQISKECKYGKFNRSIEFNQDINLDTIAANFNNSILQISIQKLQKELKPNTFKINIQ